MRALFWTAWVIAAIVTGVSLYFFFVGLADGSVSSFNLVLWMGVVAATLGVTGGSLWLRKNHPVLATVVAMLLGLPGLLAGLLLLALALSHPRWN
jgi:hypothetical protein